MEAWLERYRLLVTGALIAISVVGMALWWDRRPTPRELVITTPTSERGRWLTVEVAGAVAKPGLYTLREGSRVADALDAAGGEMADADLTRINRAVKLRDEQQIRVPRFTPIVANAPSGSTAAATDNVPNLTDINNATAAQLEALPGIGPVTAQHILAYRDKNGPFSDINQLKDAKLVTPSTFEKIKDLVAAR